MKQTAKEFILRTGIILTISFVVIYYLVSAKGWFGLKPFEIFLTLPFVIFLVMILMIFIIAIGRTIWEAIARKITIHNPKEQDKK